MQTQKNIFLKFFYALGIVLGVAGIVIWINLSMELIPQMMTSWQQSIFNTYITFVLIVVDIIILALLFIGVQSVRKYGLEKSLKRLFFIGLATFIMLGSIVFVFEAMTYDSWVPQYVW